MRAILLAGGKGTRLYPVTKAISKHLLPIYNKPLIYYPLSTLMLANIRDILIICNPEHLENYQHLLGDGQQFGLNICYKIQQHPNGIAEAFIVGREFIGNDDVCLILGDNIFYGAGLSAQLNERTKILNNAVVFGYQVHDPQRYGVLTFDADDKVTSIEEKPLKPKSNYAITGLYFYPNNVVDVAKSIKKSERNELEISDVNTHYLKNNKLEIKFLGRGFSWFDVGTHESFLKASNFVQTVEEMQGYKIADLDEIASHMNFLSNV